MKPLEEQIIKNLMELDTSDYEAVFTNTTALKRLTEEESFGTLSPEFINHSALNSFIASILMNNEYKCMNSEYLILGLRIEEYLSNINDMVLAQEKFIH